jgi:hypothetical protein
MGITKEIAEILGVNSTDVEVTTQGNSQTVRVLVELNQEQQSKLDYYLATGKELGGWIHDYALRIIVPKALIQQYREILIFKSYFEVMGLPIEILPDEIHLYCNEILEQDSETINNLKPYGVKVETR